MANEEPPSWFTNFMKKIAGPGEDTEQTEQAASSKRSLDEGDQAPTKRIHKDPLPPKAPGPPLVDNDNCEEDDDFDRRFGHLFTPQEDSENITNFEENIDENNNVEEINVANQDDDDDTGSVDEDLAEILEKVPNWETTSSIKNFIIKCVDKPLPKQMLEDLSKDYTPSEILQKYFVPPKMPPRLFKAISKMKNKNAVITERNLYNAQEQQLIIAKPLISALVELKPLGPAVSAAREKMSISLHGIFSVSLQISHARRSNVRFLIKEALADALFAYEPSHASIFGGTDFCSQVEKAAKEAKLDFNWSKTKSLKQPFRNRQGFRGSFNAGNYFHQRSYTRQQNQRRYNNYNKNNHYPNYNNNKNNNNSNNFNSNRRNYKHRGGPNNYGGR